MSFVAGPTGRQHCAAAGTTGVRRRTAITTRRSTAAVASSASAISGTRTAAVVLGFSRADGANECRMGPPAAGPLYEPVLMLPIFIYLSSLYRNNNNNIGNNNYYKHTSNNDKSNSKC